MYKYTIGIDIGGSKIIGALVKGGRVFYKIKIETPKNKKTFLIKLQTVIEQLIKKAGGRQNIKGIGCGIGGVLDLKKGIILNAPNLRFLNNFNIKNWLEQKFSCKVKIDNDARCFTRGEHLFGAGKNYKNIIGMTLGTGIGGGIIMNNKMFYGANDSAGEIGHMVINPKSQKLNLKTYDLEELTVKQIRKNKFSKKAVKEFEKNLGIGIANIINILDPEAIIIGGGATVERFLSKVKKEKAKFIISPKSRKNVKILIGKLGESAGAIGAAALF